MKRVVLTGASGFIGANLARRLLEDGHEVHLLVRPGYARWRLEAIHADLHIHEIHLGNEESVAHGVSLSRPDWVFHLAAHGAYSSQTDVRRMIQTNILGTVNLVEASLKVGFEAFVNTGSSSEYGGKDHAPCETEWLEPNSSYAVSKACATQFCRYMAQSRHVHIPTLRLYSVYGPYEEPTRLMPTLIIRGLNGELPPLVNAEISRDFVYMKDVEEAYILAASRPNQEPGAIYNVGTGLCTPMHEMVEMVRRVMGIAVEPQWGSMPDRQWDTKVWVSDNRKIKDTLGWKPHYTVEQGFRRMVAWLRENPALLRWYQERLDRIDR